MATDRRPKYSIHKIAEELKEYATIAFYLYVCFSVILLYKTSILRAYGINYEPYGWAAIKALILAKFMMMANVLRVGDRAKVAILAYRVAFKSFAYVVSLGVLSIVEETIVGALHGRAMIESLSRIAGGTWLQVVATCLLFWLFLIPFVAIKEIGGVLGKDRLHRMLFGGGSLAGYTASGERPR